MVKSKRTKSQCFSINDLEEAKRIQIARQVMKMSNAERIQFQIAAFKKMCENIKDENKN